MKVRNNLAEENKELKARLAEAEELLAAIKGGEVDAFVTDDQRVFTLKSADHAYRVLVETISEGALTLTFDGTVMYSNGRVAAMLGVPGDIVGSSIFDHVSPDELPRLKSTLRQSENSTVRAEFQLKKNDGTLLPVLISCNALKLADTTLCMIITDLTEQKKTALELEKHREHLQELVKERTAKLQESEQRYSALFANKINGMAHCRIITNDQGRPVDYYIMQINEAYERIIGLKKADVEGRRVKEVFPDIENYALDYIGIYGKIALEGGEIKFEEYFEATQQYLSIYAYCPKPGEFIAIFTDITARKQAEEARNRSERTLAELIERSPFGTYIVDSHFRIAMMNASSQVVAFRNVRPVIGRPFAEAMHILWPEPVAAEIIAAFRHTLETGEPYYSPRFTNPRRDVEIVESYEWELHRMMLPNEQYGVICYYFDSTSLRHAEEALTKTSQLLSESQKIAHLGSFEYIAESRTTVWSEEEFRIYGLDPAGPSPDYEVMLDKHIHPEDKARLRATFASAIQCGSVYELEHRIVRPDGSVRVVYDRARPYFDANGKLVRYVGATLDVTDRNQAEEALRESEMRLRRFYDSGMVGVIYWDMNGVITEANDKFLEMTGYTRKELITGKIDWMKMTPSEYRHLDEKAAEELRITGVNKQPFEKEYIRKDGTRIPIVIAGAMLDEERRDVVAFVLDITERKRSEEALKASELRYRKLFESAKDGILILDFDSGLIVDVNPFLTELLGYSREYLCKKYLWEIGPFKDVASSKESYVRLQATNNARYEDLLIQVKDGEKIDVEFVSNVYWVEHAKVIQCNIRDITMRKRAEEVLRRDEESLRKLVEDQSRDLLAVQMELEHAKRLSDIGMLAATVAHELRNPLAAISMAAHNIKRKAKNPDFDKHVATIEKKVGESNQIITNLLFYSRLKEPHYENIKLYDILEECAGALEMNGKQEVTVAKNYDAIRDAIIEADTVQIREVFNNLLNNARDAISPENGLVKIIAEYEDEFVKVVIEDNGSGMTNDILDKIFDPFFTTKAKGTGLGLSICKQIVNMHDGEIGVKSSFGQGTSVIVRLLKKERTSGC